VHDAQVAGSNPATPLEMPGSVAQGVDATAVGSPKPSVSNPLHALMASRMAFMHAPSTAPPPPPSAGAPSQHRRALLCSSVEPPVFVPEPLPSPNIEFERVGRATVRHVKAATMPTLVAWLAYFVTTTDQARPPPVPGVAPEPSSDDPEFGDTFFTCMPLITSTESFMQTVHSLYDELRSSGAWRGIAALH
jgi:hypothetical protein